MFTSFCEFFKNFIILYLLTLRKKNHIDMTQKKIKPWKFTNWSKTHFSYTILMSIFLMISHEKETSGLILLLRLNIFWLHRMYRSLSLSLHQRHIIWEISISYYQQWQIQLYNVLMRKSSEGHFKVFIVWLLKTNTTKEEFLKNKLPAIVCKTIFESIKLLGKYCWSLKRRNSQYINIHVCNAF